MDPYETLGITPAYEGDLKALRNRLVKRYFEAGEAPDEERMKAINLAYEMLSDPAWLRPPDTAMTITGRVPRPGSFSFTLQETGFVVHATPPPRRVTREAVAAAIVLAASIVIALSWLLS